MKWLNRWRHRGFPGVNLVGYARGGLGLGETLRQLAQALEGQGLPFAVVDIDLHLGDRGRDERLASRLSGGHPYPVNLIVVAPSELQAVQALLGPAFFEGRLNIGYWFWELEGFPAAWLGAFDGVDEVWTATDFVADGLRPHTRKPVRLLPHPVAVPSDLVGLPHERRRALRQRLGLPADGFQFLCTFDFHSYLARKNPMAAVRAFLQAFGEVEGSSSAPGGGPRLILKSMNGHAVPQAREALQAAVGEDPRIVLMDRFLDHRAQMELMAACDAYVSLHRSEGFGQGMAEAMGLERLVIASAYSGNLAFMDTASAALVPVSRVAVGPLEYPYGEGQHWAEPDGFAAAALMRRAVADGDWCRAMGRAARETVSRRCSPSHAARVLSEGVRQALAHHRAT